MAIKSVVNLIVLKVIPSVLKYRTWFTTSTWKSVSDGQRYAKTAE